VLLIEANLRSPSVARSRGVAPVPGLAQVVAGEASLEAVVQPAATDNGREGVPDVVTAGIADGSEGVPYELLDADSMIDLLRQADEQYDYVVVDTAPLGAVADAIPLVRHVDGVLIVSRSRRTTRTAAESLRELLRALGAPVLGVVAIGVKSGGELGGAEPRGWGRSARPRARSRVGG
jgi:Mrp family chromosome partitioning ATPase